MFSGDTSITNFDPEVCAAITDEQRRQETHVQLIASENHVESESARRRRHSVDQQVR